ncbi:MAG: hypothetical protein BJ554DRAFT_7017, partial [Olpidium bornovanus]
SYTSAYRGASVVAYPQHPAVVTSARENVCRFTRPPRSGNPGRFAVGLAVRLPKKGTGNVPEGGPLTGPYLPRPLALFRSLSLSHPPDLNVGCGADDVSDVYLNELTDLLRAMHASSPRTETLVKGKRLSPFTMSTLETLNPLLSHRADSFIEAQA